MDDPVALTVPVAEQLIAAAAARIRREMPARTAARLLDSEGEKPCSIAAEDGRIVYVDPVYLRLSEYSPEEVIGRTHRILRSDYQSAVFYAHLKEVLAAGDVWWGEFCNRSKNGRIFWIECGIAPVVHEGCTFLVALARDNTAGHRTDSALQLHDLVLEQMAEAVVIADARSPDLPVIYVNEAWERLTGFTAAEATGSNCRFMQGGGTAPTVVAEIRRCIETRQPFQGEVLNYRKDGSPFWNLLEIRPVHGANNELTHYVGTCTDVTERRHFRALGEFEQTILEMLARARPLDDVLRGIVSAVEQQFTGLRCVVDMVDQSDNCLRPRSGSNLPADLLEMLNGQPVAAAGGLCSATAATGVTVVQEDLRVLPESPIKARLAALGFRAAWAVPIASGSRPVVGTLMTLSPSARGPTRSEREFSEVAARLAAIAIERWIDDDLRSHLERQLRRAQKMEAVGTLAGGIAHDFNNILTGIFGFVQLAREDLPPDHGAHVWLEEVMAAAMRARDVVRQILTFSRQQEQEISPCDLAGVTQEALKLIRAVLPATVELDLLPPRELPFVRADPVQVHQALVNLCTNAWHAMADGAGRIRVELLDTVLPRDGLTMPTDLKAGRYVCIAVRDNGEGMTADMLDRIFEPFFTTKGPGKGSGLGLSVVHGIMQAQNGGVLVESRRGEGSSFYLAFPAEATPPAEAPPTRPLLVKGDGQSLLLVDDEKPIVGWLRALLKRSGYSVEGYVQPVEALAAFEANPEKYDLVLTDLTMPGLTGVDLARRIHLVRREVPVILMSGYDDVATPDHLLDVGVDEVLRKPLMAETLTTAIHRVLQARGMRGRPPTE